MARVLDRPRAPAWRANSEPEFDAERRGWRLDLQRTDREFARPYRMIKFGQTCKFRRMLELPMLEIALALRQF